MKNSFRFAPVAALAAVFSLSACGDDVTEVTEVHQDGMAVLAAGEELDSDACDENHAGDMVYVSDSTAAFVCDGESWQTMKGANGKDGEDGKNGLDGKDGAKGDKGDAGKDGQNGDPGKNGKDGNDGEDGDAGNAGVGCSAKSVKNAAGLEGVEIACGDAFVDTLWNGKDGQNGAPGKDGQNGAPGKDGEDGTSCTAVANDDNTGFVLTCDDEFVGTIMDGEKGDQGDACTATALAATADHKNGGFKITCGENSYDMWNGENGGKGDQGETGAGCTLVDDENGSVTVTCGAGTDAVSTVLYKAVCGTEPYDPTKKFCSEGELYSCNDKPYDPKAQLCDTRDNQLYKLVTIGTQVWMAENLNFAYNEPTDELDSSSFCYNNSADSCAKYGRLYLWSAAMDSAAVFSDDGKGCGYGQTCSASGTVRGVCPEGWHLPSQAEWNTLFTAVGGSSTAGTMLKTENGWESCDGVPAGSDAYGFSALPAGNGYSNDNFLNVGIYARFWSSSEVSSGYAYLMYLNNNDEDARLGDGNMRYAFSVRCLRG